MRSCTSETFLYGAIHQWDRTPLHVREGFVGILNQRSKMGLRPDAPFSRVFTRSINLVGAPQPTEWRDELDEFVHAHMSCDVRLSERERYRVVHCRVPALSFCRSSLMSFSSTYKRLEVDVFKKAAWTSEFAIYKVNGLFYLSLLCGAELTYHFQSFGDLLDFVVRL